ncbi:MAG: hypothetical protein E4G96_01985 [Chrysiogenales bacterium]|nr:MAG: hypothetical protein E4G96_01985 [Chrysiogenales bacterium]
MESFITALTSNKLIFTAAVIISILIILSAIKKLVRLALVLLALFILYAAYLVYTGQKVPVTKKEVFEHGGKKIEELKKSGRRFPVGGV